jgi:hypothetical protein
MRISMPGLARICDEEGLYLLLINQGRMRNGHGRVLSPIGGALEARPDTSYLTAAFGATDFEKGLDLRFRVPNDRVEEVVAWAKTRTGRETTMLREFMEEVVGPESEERLLDEADIVGICETLIEGIIPRSEETVRPVAEKTTRYLVERYEVVLPERALMKFKAASQVDNPLVYFVSGEEITNGCAADGTKIGGISETILRPE